MTRVKNCHHLLPQWIEYHFLSGVDHFFISNDCSEDPRTLYWLKQYEALGIVNASYNQSFNDCRSTLPNEASHFSHLFGQAKPSCRWIGVIDLDEYIFPTKSQKSVSFIKEALLHHKTPLVRMPWVIMSHMGYENLPSKLLIDAYTAANPVPRVVHVKSFASSEWLVDWSHSHYPKFVEEISKFEGPSIDARNYHLTVDGEITSTKSNGFDCHYPSSPLYLRHYAYRAWSDYLATKVRRKYDSAGTPNIYAGNDAVVRARWIENYEKSNCSVLGEGHRKRISPKISSSVILHSQLWPARSGYNSSELFNTWLLGEQL